jgi:hypothetical protein
VEDDAELAKGSGGRPVATRAGRREIGEAIRNDGETRWSAMGLRAGRARGKASNTRLATAKVREDAGKANNSLPCIRRGIITWSDPGRLDT